MKRNSTQKVDPSRVSDLNTEPLLQQSVPEGHLLRSARQQMEAELTQFQDTLGGLSDEYADRAERLVRDWLCQCRGKAKNRINAIDLADFFDSGEIPPELPEALEIQALPSGNTP